jgi:hypothetical protein
MIKEPCIIADSNKKQFSYRSYNSLNKDNKDTLRLKSFMTDYTRVNNYIKSHKEDLSKYSIKIKKDKSAIFHEENTPNSKERIINKNFYLQPVMKFSPRTEFERICETLNSYYYGKIDKNLIKQQLRALGLSKVKNYNSLNTQNEYSFLKQKYKVTGPTLLYLIKEKKRLEKEEKNSETINLLTNITDIIKINKEIINEQREERMSTFEKEYNKKIDSNKKKIIKHLFAKKILSDYQKKTHFKALLNCTLNLENKNKKNEINSIFSKTHRNLANNLEEIKNYTLNTYNSVKTIKNKCVKPFHNKKKYPKEDMEYLKKLCNFTQNDYYKINTDIIKIDDDKDNEQDEIYKSLNTIIINGIKYKKNDLPNISKVILKECNYIKKYYDNENAGEGKTMITRGLSVNQFTKKYGLPK